MESRPYLVSSSPSHAAATSSSTSLPRSFEVPSLFAMDMSQNDAQNRGLVRGTLCDRSMQSIHQQQHQQQVAQPSQQAYRMAAAAPRSTGSPNWRTHQLPGDLGNWIAASPSNYTLTGSSLAAVAAAAPPGPLPLLRTEVLDQQGPSLEGYAYCIDRGNGQYTRLVPADMLPPLNEIPNLQPSPNGMVVLPHLQKAPPQGVAEMNRPVTLKPSPNSPGQKPDRVQKQIDRIVATTPSTPKRVKIYCDKWVHEGICAFTQQGCKYKHEMPFDKATQHSLGLYQGLPAWYKKHQAEVLRQKDVEESAPSGRRQPAALPDRTAAADKGTWRKANAAAAQQNQRLLPPVSPAADLSKRSEALRPLSMGSPGSLNRSIWGPIEPPHKPGSGSSSPEASERSSWTPGSSNQRGLKTEREFDW